MTHPCPNPKHLGGYYGRIRCPFAKTTRNKKPFPHTRYTRLKLSAEDTFVSSLFQCNIIYDISFRMPIKMKILFTILLLTFMAFLFLIFYGGHGATYYVMESYEENITEQIVLTAIMPTNTNNKSDGDRPDFNIGKSWGRLKIEPQQQQQNLSVCPEIPPGLQGAINVDMRMPLVGEIEREYPELELGGHWMPKNCTSNHRVAIVVPYRDREEHLRGFLHHLHGIFQAQQLDYTIFVVEQTDNLTFNRGRLINIGFLESQRFYPWQCFVFHDIDALPENDKNIYSCPESPKVAKHMTVAYEKNNYKIFYETYFSGAIILNEQQFRRANGFSNDYWGWGGEDDDFYSRLVQIGMDIQRNPLEIARYKQFDHKKDAGNPVNPCRWKLLSNTKSRQSIDGLTSLSYRLKSIEFNMLYTHIKVDLLEEEFNKWKEYSQKTLKAC